MPRKANTVSEEAAAEKSAVRKSAARSSSAKKAAQAEETVATSNVVSADVTAEAKAESKASVKVKETLDPHSYVTIRNGFNGKLVYISKRTGERLVWDTFGAEQEIELQELKNAKNSSRAFFENNWFMIDDPEVVASLGVERYYKNALNYEDFDTIFELTPSEIEKKIAVLSNGQRRSVAYRARQKIADGEIDSMRVIDALEKSLAIELVER